PAAWKSSPERQLRRRSRSQFQRTSKNQFWKSANSLRRYSMRLIRRLCAFDGLIRISHRLETRASRNTPNRQKQFAFCQTSNFSKLNISWPAFSQLSTLNSQLQSNACPAQQRTSRTLCRTNSLTRVRAGPRYFRGSNSFGFSAKVLRIAAVMA